MNVLNFPTLYTPPSFAIADSEDPICSITARGESLERYGIFDGDVLLLHCERFNPRDAGALYVVKNEFGDRYCRALADIDDETIIGIVFGLQRKPGDNYYHRRPSRSSLKKMG